MGNGDYTGYEFQTPIFVLTHQPPEQVTKGQNDKLKVYFVTDGIESAVRQAKTAAGDKDVMVVGGAALSQELLKRGLGDELQLGIMPMLFGTGLRFFEHLEETNIKLELMRVIQTPPTTDLWYRSVK